jgi:hypothetical protein
MTRWMHPPELDHERKRDHFDPVVEGARHALARELSLAIWDRVCADATDRAGRRDMEQAQQRFHELAARIAARGGRLRPDVGRVTRVGVEINGDSRGPWNADELRPRVPGRETLFAVEARRWRKAGDAAPAEADQAMGRRELPGASEVARAMAALQTPPQPHRSTPPRLPKDVAKPSAPGRWTPVTDPNVFAPRPTAATPPMAVMRSAERPEVDPAAADLLARARRGGAPLDSVLRPLLEGALGTRLDGVRVHTGADADAAANALGARAFAVGDDVVFRDGAYEPRARDGQRLIAHEVAHTVQARGATSPTGGAMTVSQAGDPLEREADAFAEAFVRGIETGPGEPAAPTELGRVAPEHASEVQGEARDRRPTSPEATLEHEPRPVAGTANAPAAMVRPSPRAASLVQREVVGPPEFSRYAFRFRVGVELDPSFVELARRLVGAGALHAPELRALRQHALDRHGTVDDHERMFMAALMMPANAVALAITPVGPSASVTFGVLTITPNLKAVIDLDRETMPLSVSSPLAAAATDLAAFHAGGLFANTAAAGKAAEHEIRAHARGFDTEVSALLKFATQTHVDLPNLLMAMLAGASDSSAGDQLMAGTVYAIAAAAGHPLAGDLLAGHVKVDGMLPAQLGALSPNPQVRLIAMYASEAGDGRKGDTLYVPVDLNINDISERSAVIHELRHALDDSAAGPGSVRPAPGLTQVEMEATAFRAQMRYVLEQMLAQAPADRAATAQRLMAQIEELEGLAMIVEAVSDRARFAPVMAAITTAAHPLRAEDIANLMKFDATTLEKHLRDRIMSTYGLPPDQIPKLDGFRGESTLRVPPPPPK